MNIRSLLWPAYSKIKTLTSGNDTLSRILENIRLNLFPPHDAMLMAIVQKAPSGAVIYDIGAHIGSYSIFLAKKSRGSLIYAFEPNISSFDELTRNINLMRVKDKVIPRNIALSDSCGQSTFYVSSASRRSSLREYNAKRDGNQVIKAMTVDCFSIDYLVEKGICKPPDVIKVDVEGHEFEVIRGASNVILSRAPQIFFEAHSSEGQGNNEDGIKSFLAKFGYKFKKLGYPVWCYKELEHQK